MLTNLRRHHCLLLLLLLCAGGVFYTFYYGRPKQLEGLLQVTQLIPSMEPVATTLSLVRANLSENDVISDLRRYTNSVPKTNEVTVVTAYFNIGSLRKTATGEGRYTPDLYKKWMSTFGNLDNPLIVFADTQETVDHFRQLRARYPPERTTIFLVKREELWAFRLEKEIAAIYAQPHYPKHPPNTINALYSCAMHAKFELVQRVIRQRLFKTPYVAWLDIGLFRAEVNKNAAIHLTVPSNFDPTKVGYSEVNKFQNMSAHDVVSKNKVWVGGACFVGRADVVYEYCSEYRAAVRKLIDMKLMSTDQQVIYIMNQPSFHSNFKPKVQLQRYTTGSGGDWFHIGYVMKDAS